MTFAQVRAHTLPQIEAMHAEAIAHETRTGAGSSLRLLQGMRIAIASAFSKSAAADANELQQDLVRQIRGEESPKQNVKANRRSMMQRIKGFLGGG